MYVKYIAGITMIISNFKGKTYYYNLRGNLTNDKRFSSSGRYNVPSQYRNL